MVPTQRSPTLWNRLMNLTIALLVIVAFRIASASTTPAEETAIALDAAPQPNPTPTPKRGTCHVHIIQTKNVEPTKPSSLYVLEVEIKDAGDTVVGKAFRQAPKDEPVECTKPLPYILQVFAGAEDWDSLRFICGSQSWGGDDR